MGKLLKEKTFCHIFNFIGTLLFFVLFYHCLSMTGENLGPSWDEHIIFKRDSVLANIFWILVSLVFLYYIGKISGKLTMKIRNVMLGSACVLSAVISFYWVLGSKAGPVGDQSLICQYANAFNRGDFQGLLTGRYIARCPQQIGMVTLLRGIFLMFGESNYQMFQYMVAALVPVLVLSGCKIVRLLSDCNAKAELYYLLFAVCCFPMYAYTVFVYGDLISIIAGMFSAWMYLGCLKCFSWWRLAAFGLSIGAAICLRNNFLILLIALAIVTFVKLCFERKWKYFAMLAALVLGWGGMQTAVWGIYHDVRTEDAPAIPALLYIVMGLNDDYQYPGWYNQYNYVTFAHSNDNVELAKAKAWEDLHMYLEIYKNDPDYMVDFFTRKMNAQWNAPMFQSIAMNSDVEGEQLPLVKNIYEHGKLGKFIEAGMKLFQMLMYGGILFLLVMRRREYVEIEKYLLLIAVFGGFLFSLMWEAKTRYVLPYLFMQIPYMAMGVGEIVSWMEKAVMAELSHKFSIFNR